MHRPQKKRALRTKQKKRRVEVCKQLLSMREEGALKLEDIWFSNETNLCANKLGANSRSDTVWKHEDKPVENMAS